jgi:YHS domain-containing protein
MRLLILAALICLGYRALKARIGSGHQNADADLQHMDDEMIQDPFCGAYFPRKNAVRASVEKKDFLFCSKKCRDAYLSRGEKD